MDIALILVFLNCMKEFHVNVDASSVMLGIVFTQPSEGDIDNLIAFSSRKLSSMKENYIMMEREWLCDGLRIAQVSTPSVGRSFQDVH